MNYLDSRREVRYCVDLMCTVGTNKIEMKVVDVSINSMSIVGNAIFYQLHTVDVDVMIEKYNHVRLHTVVRECVRDSSSSKYGLEIFNVPKKWVRLVESYARSNSERTYA